MPDMGSKLEAAEGRGDQNKETWKPFGRTLPLGEVSHSTKDPPIPNVLAHECFLFLEMT